MLDMVILKLFLKDIQADLSSLMKELWSIGEISEGQIMKVVLMVKWLEEVA